MFAGVARWLTATFVAAGGLIAALVVAAVSAAAAEPPELTVSVGGGEEAFAYLPVHAAAALGTFAAEGVGVTLRRAKHPTAAVSALRDGEAAVAVTTADQAIRGAWARGTPVRILVAHTRAPGVALLVSARQRGRIGRLEDLRGARVGIPGPGTTGHLVLTTLLERVRIEPWQLQLVSLGGSALVSRLGSGDLAAAIVEEPWTSRALGAGAAAMLLDLRQAEDAARHLGGPFYEVVSVVRAADPELAALAPALAAYARAVIRVQAWLATTPAGDVAARLPPAVVGDRERFVARLGALQGAVAPDGEATLAGLATTLAVLRAGTPWPASLKVTPEKLREPPAVTAARAALGPTPPAP
ncbi:MAG TPA: ABC transporter substrate-binding protein [Methylomirabilota bacterium]|nr:ABC transporter substrate-binding protein [Methylomirabilota bacterium]